MHLRLITMFASEEPSYLKKKAKQKKAEGRGGEIKKGKETGPRQPTTTKRS